MTEDLLLGYRTRIAAEDKAKAVNGRVIERADGTYLVRTDVVTWGTNGVVVKRVS